MFHVIGRDITCGKHFKKPLPYRTQSRVRDRAEDEVFVLSPRVNLCQTTDERTERNARAKMLVEILKRYFF